MLHLINYCLAGHAAMDIDLTAFQGRNCLFWHGMLWRPARLLAPVKRQRT